MGERRPPNPYRGEQHEAMTAAGRVELEASGEAPPQSLTGAVEPPEHPDVADVERPADAG